MDGELPVPEVLLAPDQFQGDELIGGPAVEAPSPLPRVDVRSESDLREVEVPPRRHRLEPEAERAEGVHVRFDFVVQDHGLQPRVGREPPADDPAQQPGVGERLDPGDAGREGVEPGEIPGMPLREEADFERLEQLRRVEPADGPGDGDAGAVRDEADGLLC